LRVLPPWQLVQFLVVVEFSRGAVV
jgi:hypothetical protein